MAPSADPIPSELFAELRAVLARFPFVDQALLFGSAAAGKLRFDSDLDIAVGSNTPLTMGQKIALTNAIAEHTGRPVDLVDLATIPEPLLGQVVQHGTRLVGSDTKFGNLIRRHLIEQADFVPYRDRVLAERRKAWIGK